MPSSDSEARHWPVLVASCLATSLTHGFASSMGVFYIEWHIEFPDSSALVGWLSSSMLAMLFCFSPFAGALTKYLGVRPVVVAGCLLSFAGLLIASFAQEFYVLFLTIPFMTGIGFGMSYTGVIVIISECFHRHYALANGICTTGASIGMVVLPIIFRFLIDMYDWRGALMILSAMNLNVMVFARFMKAPSTLRQKKKHVTFRNANSIALKLQDYHQVQDIDNANEHDTSNSTTQPIACSLNSQTQSTHDCGQTTDKDDCVEHRLASQSDCSQKICSFLDHSGISLFWTNRVFSTFMLTAVSTSPVYGITLPYLAAHAKSVGITEIKATLLISVLGMSGIVSRLTHGRLVDAHVIQPAYIYVFFVALATIAAPTIAVIEGYAGFVICTALIGLASGVYIPMQAVLIRMIVGKQQFPGGFGIGLVSVAIGNMATAFIGGYIFDVTHSYSGGFMFAGVMSGVTIVLVLGTHLLWTKLIKDDRWPRVEPAVIT